MNADVPSLEALLVHEDDAFVNGLGVKGVGEIGITGTVGAIANAVWHFCGWTGRVFEVWPEVGSWFSGSHVAGRTWPVGAISLGRRTML